MKKGLTLLILAGLFYSCQKSKIEKSEASTPEVKVEEHYSAPTPALSQYLSLVKTIALGDKLYLAGNGQRKLIEFSTKDGAISRTLQLSQNPIDMKLIEGKLYICSDSPSGEIFVVDPQSLTIEKTYCAGHTPMAPVLSEDKKKLFICNRFNNEIEVFDLVSGQSLKKIAVLREPVAALRRGDTLVVANHLSEHPSNGKYTGCSLTLIDCETLTVKKHIQLNDGTTGVRGLTLSNDGRYAYLSSVLGRHRVPTTQLERGWVNTNALSIVDLEEEKLLNTVLLDDLDRGAANPWAIEARDGQIHIAIAGTHELMLLDEKAMLKAIHALDAKQAKRLPNHLTFLNAFKRRIPLVGKAPRSFALDDAGKAWVSCYFSDSLEQVDLKSGKTQSTFILGKGKMDAQRRGEFLFNDASFCFQNWMSCASCHPDTRTDAFNWDIPNDGLGTPRNVKSMLYSHYTPPTTVTGCRPNAETSVRAGIGFFMAVLPDADAKAIDSYLSQMSQIPSPSLVRGQLSESAERGKLIFKNESGCADCHRGKHLTNMKMYNVGTGIKREKKMKYDVPTLKEVWRTSPYLHDGRATTLRQVLTTFNIDDDHGETSHLSKQELDDLIEYVKSL